METGRQLVDRWLPAVHVVRLAADLKRALNFLTTGFTLRRFARSRHQPPGPTPPPSPFSPASFVPEGN